MYPRSMFKNKNKKKNVYPCKLHLYYKKWGVKGSTLHGHVFMMIVFLRNYFFSSPEPKAHT